MSSAHNSGAHPPAPSMIRFAGETTAAIPKGWGDGGSGWITTPASSSMPFRASRAVGVQLVQREAVRPEVDRGTF